MAYLAAPPINWGGDPPQAITELLAIADIEILILPIARGVMPAPKLTVGDGGIGVGGSSGYAG